jgi:hypothetical protein
VTHPLLTRAHLEATLVATMTAFNDARWDAMTDSERSDYVYWWHVEQELGRPRRRARVISYATRARIMERDDFRCRRCGAGPRDERLVVDHVLSVALGGSDDDANLQTLCEPCNIGKGARPPHPHDLEGRA